jgi:CxxC-x17-CxxC domain-containing protein
MHKAVCADCGQECEVPFKPIEGKPVYCKDCFMKRKPKF